MKASQCSTSVDFFIERRRPDHGQAGRSSTVFGGTWVQTNLGETKSVTDCVNFPGMIRRLQTSGEVMRQARYCWGGCGGACAFAGAETTVEIPRIAHAVRICLNFILLFSLFRFAGVLIGIAGHRYCTPVRGFSQWGECRRLQLMGLARTGSKIGRLKHCALKAQSIAPGAAREAEFFLPG